MGKTTRAWKVLALARQLGWRVEEEPGGWLLSKGQEEVQFFFDQYQELDEVETEYYQNRFKLNSEDL